jgi:hypothetical protein
MSLPHITHQFPCQHFHPRAHTCAVRGRRCDYLSIGKRLPDCEDFAPGKYPRAPTGLDPAETNKRKYAVVTLCIGETTRELATLTQPSQRAYAARIGAEFIEITESKPQYAYHEFLHYNKWQIFNLFERFERIIYLDVDLLVRPDCPNLFDLVPESHIGGENELLSYRDQAIHLRSWYEAMGLPPVECHRYLNAGVFVASRCHRDLFKPPEKIVDSDRSWREQNHFNYRLLVSKTPVTELPQSFNDRHRPQEYLQNSYVLHYASMEETERRIQIKHDIAAWKQQSLQVKKLVKITLHMDACVGDWLVLSAACESLWQDHPHLRFRFGDCEELHRGAPWACLCPPDKSIKVCYGSGINRSAQTDVRFLPTFYEDLRDKLDLTGYIKTNKPHVYLSLWEMQLPRQIEGDYVVINAGHKIAQEVKQWGHENWQAVTDWLRTRGLQVVQIGQSKDVHRPLRGAIDLIDKTDLRQLIRLAYWSKFGLGPESLIHHVYASHFHTPDGRDREAIPFVCLASGWNPKGWASYNSEVYLTRQGQLDCCQGSQGCWRGAMTTCAHPEPMGTSRVGRCMKMIAPSEVIRAIEAYYTGGILT